MIWTRTQFNILGAINIVSAGGPSFTVDENVEPDEPDDETFTYCEKDEDGNILDLEWVSCLISCPPNSILRVLEFNHCCCERILDVKIKAVVKKKIGGIL